MGATWRGLLRAGVLVVSAVVTVSCAAPQMQTLDPSEKKLKLNKLKLDLTDSASPIKTLEFEHKVLEELDACTDQNACRLGYPMKNGKELLGTLTRPPLLILTDIASPGETCVCYGTKCKCTK